MSNLEIGTLRCDGYKTRYSCRLGIQNTPECVDRPTGMARVRVHKQDIGTCVEGSTPSQLPFPLYMFP